MRVEVDVDLSDFDDCEVLEAALYIIRTRGKGVDARKIIGEMEAFFVAAALEETLPPISTAARVKTLEEAKAAVQ